MLFHAGKILSPSIWLVDLNTREIIVYRKPEGAQYSERAVFRNGDMLPVPGVQDARIAVTELGL